MSDFLSNLAARGINKAKVVRPRLASLFEPQKSLFIMPVSEYLQSEHSVEHVHEDAAPENTSDALPERHDAEMKHSDWEFRQTPRQGIRGGPEDIEQHALMPNMEKTPKSALEEHSVAQRNRSDPLQAPSARADETEISNLKDGWHRLKSEPAFQEDMLERSTSHSEVRLHLNAVGSLPEIARQKAIEFASLRSKSELISAVSRGQQLVQPAVRADRSEIVNINSYPLHLPATHYSEPAALHQAGPLDMPEPTIEVTIGRIEVRATPSVSQPRAQSQKPPKMSLDEYLHHRSKGGIK